MVLSDKLFTKTMQTAKRSKCEASQKL